MSSTIIPKKLAIYYGYPSSVNATYTVSGAANVLKDYDQVVLGAGLEETSHPDHTNTVNIINDPVMVNTECFGYIDATLSVDVVQDKIDLWKDCGVKGIFFDQFGYDFSVSRQKQRELLWCVKSVGLKSFVNAWNPDDVFSPAVNATFNPNGKPTRMRPQDTYLAESFAVMNGAYDNTDSDSNGIKDFQDKATKMKDYRTTYGSKLAACTTSNSSPFDQAKADYSYCIAAANGFDSWGYGEELFSASSAQLPFRTRYNLLGTRFMAPLSYTSGVIERQTNIGIHVNTTTNTVSTLLD